MTDDASDILDLANKRVKQAKDSWSEVYQAAKDDLHFLSDKPYAQWDSKAASDRITIGRPALQIDQLSQFIHQVSNDIRMNTPTIKIIPDGMDSDPETAEIIAGRIKAIEYKSNADAAYDMAADFAVKSSIGFIRVDRGYVEDDGFEQELKICRVVNPLAILLDPDSTEPDGSDARFAFVFDEISKDDFEKKWPEAAPKSFGDETAKPADKGSDKIVIAEYFCIVDDEKDIGLLDDGSTEPYDKKKKYKSRRKVSKRKVMHYTLAGDDILAKTTFPGKYVPIVPVYGEESWESGVRHLFSLIRKSKSAQQMYNLWKSLETELLLKQQQAPVQAAVGQMRGFEEDWKQPDKAMVLYYHQTDANGDEAPAPQRLQPPTIPTGIVNAARETVDDIRSTMGMYRASVGDNREAAKSGIALKQLEQSGDVASFHFGDNLIRSITHVGKILVCALPEVEDTPRVVQTIGKEDEMKPIGINGKVVDKQEKTFDFTKGRYDVRVTTGASFTTQRQEAAALYMETLKILPPEIAVQTLDLVFKYQDAPGSQALAARFKKLVDPKLLDEKDREEGQPDPQVMQLTAQLQEVTAQAQQQIQALQAELENKRIDNAVKLGELEIDKGELEIKQADLKLKYITALQPQQKESLAAQPAAPLAMADEPIEVLQARIIHKAQQEEQQRQKSQMDAEFEAGKEQREYELEQQELQLKAADMQARDMQARALIQGIGSIQQTLGVLVQSVQAPIDMVRDEQGNLVRIQ